MKDQKENALKLKRQVRDFFNKQVHDCKMLRKIAELIGFEVKDDDN